MSETPLYITPGQYWQLLKLRARHQSIAPDESVTTSYGILNVRNTEKIIFYNALDLLVIPYFYFCEGFKAIGLLNLENVSKELQPFTHLTTRQKLGIISNSVRTAFQTPPLEAKKFL